MLREAGLVLLSRQVCYSERGNEVAREGYGAVRGYMGS